MTDQSPQNVNDAAARVAFDLMNRIANAERGGSPSTEKENARQYYLALFAECRKAVYGSGRS